MRVQLVSLPVLLRKDQLHGRTAVVLDVLRATTTMTAALAAGAAEIRPHASVEHAAEAASRFNGPKLLCGERHCLPLPGFDLGNSPGDFTPRRCAGRTLFMATSHGTVALLAARDARSVLVGCLNNASAVAERVLSIGDDVVLLGAGTENQETMEDVFGGVAVIEEMRMRTPGLAVLDVSESVFAAFDEARGNLSRALRATRGGINVLAAGLERDIDFAARLNVSDVVGAMDPGTLLIRRLD